MGIIAFLVVCCGALALLRYLRWRWYWHRKLAPFGGPKVALPLIGTLHYALGPMDTILDRGLRLAKYFGNNEYVSFWLGERPWLHIMRPEDLECVLGSNKLTTKPEVVYGTVSGFFGRGLITLSGESWFRHRHVLTPAFHFTVLERYSGIFTRRAAAFAAKMKALPEGESFDFMPHISSFVTGTVMETAFGLQDDSSKAEAMAREDFIKAADDAFQIIAHRVVKPWLMVEPIFRLTKLGRQQQHADKIINEYANKVIRLKKEEIRRRREEAGAGGTADTAEEPTADADVGVRKKYTFLDLVLEQDSELMSDEEILNEVRTLIAVQQTSASTLSFVAVCLALHPDVQRLAREEVLRVDAEEGLSPIERLNRLKYVERVVKETLRLYPITSIFSRTISEDTVLTRVPTKTGGEEAVTLPAGLNITAFIYLTHRDPRHWPRPEHFDPDRFLPERSAGRHPYAYVPFSAGPRNCIGQRYAMLQMKAVVAALLRQVELLPGTGCEHWDNLPLNMNTFLYLRGGFNVRIRRREAAL